MARTTAFIPVAAAALALAGCGDASVWYEAPKSALPHLSSGPFILSVSQVERKTCMETVPGVWKLWPCLGVHVTARNAGDKIAEFDPEDLVLSAPELGRKFRRANKSEIEVDGKVPPGGVRNYWNLALKNPIRPGASYSAVVWYDTAETTDQIRSVDLLYKDVSLHLRGP